MEPGRVVPISSCHDTGFVPSPQTCTKVPHLEVPMARGGLKRVERSRSSSWGV